VGENVKRIHGHDLLDSEENLIHEKRTNFVSRYLTGLWRDPNFLRFWFGETVSLFGSHISYLALPLTAAITLGATPTQMGFLNAAKFAPFLIITLFAGVWVDHRTRRPILIWTNIGRGLLIGLIPLLAWFGRLRMEWMYWIVFLAGILTVFFELAYQAFFPVLVRRDQIMEGNSKLQASASVAEIGGPGIAGYLVALMTAPFAILLDALSFLISAVSLLFVRVEEAPSQHVVESRDLMGEIREGIEVVFGNPYLRAIAGEAATYNLFWQVMETVFVLYVTRELNLGPKLLGMIVATGSIGALIGAMIAAPLAQRIGVGKAILSAMLVGCALPLLIPLTKPGSQFVIVLPVIAYFLGGIGVAVSNVHVVSLRQSITPDHLLGRMTASYRMVIFGTLPLGALLGGFLGEAIGLRLTLLVGALGLVSALFWVIFSPLRNLQKLP
jgi:MFS family permease